MSVPKPRPEDARLIATWRPEDRGAIVGYRIRTGHTYAHIAEYLSGGPLAISMHVLCRGMQSHLMILGGSPEHETHWDAKRDWAHIPSITEAVAAVKATGWGTPCPKCIERATR